VWTDGRCGFVRRAAALPAFEDTPSREDVPHFVRWRTETGAFAYEGAFQRALFQLSARRISGGMLCQGGTFVHGDRRTLGPRLGEDRGRESGAQHERLSAFSRVILIKVSTSRPLHRRHTSRDAPFRSFRTLRGAARSKYWAC